MKSLARLLILMILLGMLAACAAPAAETPAAEQPAAQEAPVEQPATDEPSAAAPTTEEPAPAATEEIEAGPQVGGTFIYGNPMDPDTLDPHKSIMGYNLLQFTGSTLVAVHPQTKEIVPYLAASWEISADGLTYTFHLRNDVTFQDGTPLTAQDYAWTLNRLKAPETASAYANFAPTLLSAEAADELTLILRLAAPDYYFLYAMAAGCMQPLSEAYVTAQGENFGREPNGVGAFWPKEWSTGERVVLERNPNFTWGPPFTHGGPAYIQEIEFRILPDPDTVIAGIEAGELDYAFVSSPNLIDRIMESGQYDLVKLLNYGSTESIFMNQTRTPFDNLLVRKAFNMAIDRELLVKVIANDYGKVLYGPISSSTIGYWPGVEEIGYRYDLEQAKSLMQEAGFTYNADGLLEKDGQPLKLTLSINSFNENLSVVIQEQLKALGVQVELLRGDPQQQFVELGAGNFDFVVYGFNWSNASVLQWMFDSSYIGMLNMSRINDPEMDRLLKEMVTATTVEANQAAVEAIQRRSIEQAYTVPLYASENLMLVNKRFANVIVPDQLNLYLWDTFLVEP